MFSVLQEQWCCAVSRLYAERDLWLDPQVQLVRAGELPQDGYRLLATSADDCTCAIYSGDHRARV